LDGKNRWGNVDKEKRANEKPDRSEALHKNEIIGSSFWSTSHSAA
jgi:hypothetical protein